MVSITTLQQEMRNLRRQNTKLKLELIRLEQERKLRKKQFFWAVLARVALIQILLLGFLVVLTNI